MLMISKLNTLTHNIKKVNTTSNIQQTQNFLKMDCFKRQILGAQGRAHQLDAKDWLYWLPKDKYHVNHYYKK